MPRYPSSIRNFLMLLIFVCGGFVTACGPAKDKQENGAGDSTRTSSNQNRNNEPAPDKKKVITGAEILLAEKITELKGKRLAITANHTSLAHGLHLVDTLHRLGLDIRKVFAPEHGFRGDQDAGKKIADGKDPATGIPIVSLYGKNKKPSAAQLADVDIILFDIQDVGARFYTYISTMTYLMEAAAEQDKMVWILDRPNPNGWYVNGPVLESKYKSFVGMHNIPIVHGMTVGEYARMVNYEGWLSGNTRCKLSVVQCRNYKHAMRWEETGLDWVAPSPNLATWFSAYLYPMLCWYEGMAVSVGRGTNNAFEMIGAPWHEGYRRSLMKDSIMEAEAPGRVNLFGLEMAFLKFTPRSIPGKSTHPKFKNQTCYGVRFMNRVEGEQLFLAGLALLENWWEEAGNTGMQDKLFGKFFRNLVGNAKLEEQVKQNLRPEEIVKTWRKDLAEFQEIRKRYLLYEDF